MVSLIGIIFAFAVDYWRITISIVLMIILLGLLSEWSGPSTRQKELQQSPAYGNDPAGVIYPYTQP